MTYTKIHEIYKGGRDEDHTIQTPYGNYEIRIIARPGYDGKTEGYTIIVHDEDGKIAENTIPHSAWETVAIQRTCNMFVFFVNKCSVSIPQF